MSLRRRAGVLFLAVPLFGLPASADEPVAMQRLTPTEIAAPAPAGGASGTGPQMTNLVGDPTRPGLYTIKVSIPPHTQVRPHSHRDNRSVTVVSGTWHMGYGTTFDAAGLKDLPPGSFYTEPAGQPHFAQTGDEPVVIWVTGYGPSDTKFVQQSGTDDTRLPVTDLIAKLRVQEAAEPIRNRAQWRVPRKVLLLEFGLGGGWAGRQEAFASVSPKTQVVVAKDLASAIAAASDVDVIVGFNPGICDPKIIDSAKQLRWIASLAAGVENCMAVSSVHTRNLVVTNMRGVDSAVIAEHAIALMMALAHGLDVFASDTAKASWDKEHGTTTPMQALEGKTMLVVGLGGIGTEVALRAHGLGLKVVATRDNTASKPDFVSYVGLPDEMLSLAKTADVIVNSVPLTPQTTGMYDAKFFGALKPTALFINVARGPSVVTADLVAALNDHRLAGAGLDVVDPEPLPPDHPLWHAPHVLITPHMSSRSDLPGEARWQLAVENLRRYVNGEKMLSVVDLTKGY